jgi:dihydroneopterin aldolase
MAKSAAPYRFADEAIQLVNLRVSCIIGVNPEERVREQPLVFNVTFRADFSGAARDDDLGRTVNYSDVADEVRRFTREGRFQLLETLARRLAEHLCGRFQLSELTLHIRKPAAVADSDGAAVSLAVRRGRP